MPTTLLCSLDIGAYQPQNYWWPLVYEAMRRIGCGFSNPHYAPEHRGIYYPFTAAQELEDTGEGATFRELWDHVWTNRTAMNVEFWAIGDTSFMVEGHVRSSAEHTEIGLYFDSASFSELNDPAVRTQDNYSRIQRWLRGVKELYALCGPGIAEMHWERAGQIYPVGGIGKDIRAIEENARLELASSMTSFFDLNPAVGVRQETLADGAILSLLHPFPFPDQSGWVLAPLA